MTKTKVIDLDKFYNFVVVDFFGWSHLMSQDSVRSFHISKFKFWIVQPKSNGEMTKTKGVDINELYNFVVDDFFISNRLDRAILFEVFTFWN